MKNKIKTRFAPSPTGYLHLGNIRIALYSWLFSKKNNGNFILRIEDTNKSELNSYYSNEIINTMKWLKLDWDEGPIYQTSRTNRYEEITKFMLNNNKAYYCFCSKERLNSIKKEQILNKKKPKYDNFCKNLNYFSIKNNLDKNKKFVIRFKNSSDKYVYFNDWIHGKIKFYNSELDDLIIKTSSGNFTYNFCVSLDDYDMGITHVIRGDDHISNTPRQINILKSINANIPEYIHIPIILDINKNKLSKKNNLFNVNEFKKEGLLPESIINFLINFEENNKIFFINEIINKFDLKKIKKSPIIFDKKRLLHINKLYLSKLSEYDIKKYLILYFKYMEINISEIKLSLIDLIKIFKNRYYSFNDLINKSKYLYIDNLNIDKKIIYKHLNIELIEIIKNFYFKMQKIELWEINNIKKIIKESLYNKDKLVIKNFYNILRILISGTDKTPELNCIIYLIGKIKFFKRIEYIINNH